MSLDTWKKKYMKQPIKDIKTDAGAIRHSLLKWSGLKPSILARYNIYRRYDTLTDQYDPKKSIDIDSSTCALCWRHDTCRTCPLTEIGYRCTKLQLDTPYVKFIETGDPDDMLAVLKKALAYVRRNSVRTKTRKAAAIAVLALAACLPALAGPQTAKVPERTQIPVTPEFKSCAQASLDSAYRITASNNVNTTVKSEAVFVPHKGERRVMGVWCWNEPGIGDVAALISPGKRTIIQLATDPKGTPDPVLALHMSIHYLLISKGLGMKHDSLYLALEPSVYSRMTLRAAKLGDRDVWLEVVDER